MKINTRRRLKLRTCTIAIILFAIVFSTILTIPSFNVLAQNQTNASVNETETEAATAAEIETGNNETDIEDETTLEPQQEEIISTNLANASLITDKSTYSQGETVNISLLYVPPTATTNLTIISPKGIVYFAIEEKTGLYSFTETTAIGTYLISANISVGFELETKTRTRTRTLTLATEFEVIGEEGEEIGEGLKEKGEERGFDLNNASLSVDKATYALGETVRICLAAPPEVIDNYSIINPAGIFYVILPSADGEYEFKPDSAGNYVINVSLQASADGDALEKSLILTAEFKVIDLDLEIVFEEPEQGEIVVGEPVNWRQHISIANHGNISISNYAVNIPLPDDYSNLSSDFYNHKITQISTRNCGDAGCRMQDAIINLSPPTPHPSPLTSTLILIALAAGENLSFNISYQTSPVKLEVVEASIDISDLIPSDAFDVGIYKQIETGEELEEVSSLSLSKSEVKVKQVTVLHNASVHYHNIPVSIAADDDTKVVELVNGTEKEIKAEISDKNASWIVPELSNRTFMVMKKELIPEQAKAEIDTPVEWQLNVSGTIIKYKTPAPFKNESAPKIENGTWKKEITIGSKASVHYTNVAAFTNLSLEKKALPKKQQIEEGDIKLFLVENNSRTDVTDNPAYNVSFVDTDDNGLIDRVQWNVPFLSNKTFEVEQSIEVINVQSYPSVGGNWTVRFNTTGTADLTITAVNGTTWSNVNDDNDLKFLEIKCGDNILDYQWINNSVFIKNYSCDETGYEISKVLTPGKHTLEFTFGTDVEYAYNFATESLWSESNTISGGLTLAASANADGSVTGTWADASGKWAKNNYWWEFVMQNSAQTGTINSVTLYLKHYQSGWEDDNFLIQIHDGSSWIDVQSYTSVSGPPASDTTNNWDVKALGIDTWTKINASKVRIFGNGKAGGEDTVDWFVDTVELRIDYTLPDTTPPIITIDTPTESAPVYRKGGEQFWVNFTYTEDNPANYTVEVRNSTDVINTTTVNYPPGGTDQVANKSFNLNSTAADGKYNVTVEMYDNASNYNISYQNYSVVKWGWSNVTWISPPDSTEYPVGDTITLTCLVRDVNSSTGIANYPVHFYNRTDSTVTHDFGVNYTNSSGYAVMDWDTTGVSPGWYYPKCNITDNSTLFYNVSAPYEANTSIKLAAPDTEPPTYSNDGDNSTGSVTEGDIVKTYVYWADAYAGDTLSKAVLRTNKTGSWENESSWHTFTADPEWANFTIDTTGHAGKTICWVQWANDTASPCNWNTSMPTTAHCFDVLHITKTPQVLINNTNPTQGDSVKIDANLTYDNGTAIANQNVSFYYDSSFINYDYTNSTGWATVIWDTTGVSGGTYTINATYSGNSSIYTKASYNNTQQVDVAAADVIKPVPSNIGANETEAGKPCLFHAYWTDAGGLANYTFAWNDTGVWVNDSVADFSGAANWSNVTKPLNTTPKTIGWRVYANDTSGNQNDTGIQLLTIIDATPPVPSNIGANETEAGKPCLFHAYWTDTVGLANYTFAWNDTGEWVNESVVDFSGTANWSNVTKPLNTTPKTIGWRIYANDTSGNQNDTGIQLLTIIDATPPVPSNIGTNETEAGKPCLFHAYWTDTVGLANYTFAWNDTGEWVNESVVDFSGTANWSNVTKPLNTTPKTIGWRIYANDTSGNQNDTGIQILTITSDVTKPAPSNIGANETVAGKPCLFHAYWTDTVGLANYTFAWNDTGEWVNESVVDFSGTGNWSNVTKPLNATPKTIGWRIYANDTSGNQNDTGIQLLTIVSVAPGTETLTPDSLTGTVDNPLAEVQSSNDYRIGVDRGDTGGVTFTNTSIPAGSTINSVVIYYEHWEENGHTADSTTIRVGNSTDASAFGSGTVTDNIGPNANTQGQSVAEEDTDSFTCSSTPSLSQLNDLQVEFFNDDAPSPDEMWIDYIYAVADYTPPAPDLRVVAVTFDNWETEENKASVPETGTGNHVKEGRNITVNATIANYGVVNVTTDFNVSFFDCAGVYGDWSTWFGNYTYNVSAKGELGNATTGYPYNTTYAIAYWNPSLVGTHNISAWADPENTLEEHPDNVTNNNGSSLINVSAWQKYCGNVSGNIVLAGSAGNNMSTWNWPAGSKGNGSVYIVNNSAVIDWSALQALGRNKTGVQQTDDLSDADTNLEMELGVNNATGFTDNNITQLFDVNRNTTFIVHGITINYVPIINSTDMTNHTDVENAIFKTGILWDTSDDEDGDGEYDPTDKEDLVFIANIRYSETDIDYKIAIPCTLNAAIAGDLDFYVELR